MKFIRDIISEKRAQTPPRAASGAAFVLGPELARPPVGIPERVMSAPPRPPAMPGPAAGIANDAADEDFDLAAVLNPADEEPAEAQDAIYDLSEDLDTESGAAKPADETALSGGGDDGDQIDVSLWADDPDDDDGDGETGLDWDEDETDSFTGLDAIPAPGETEAAAPVQSAADTGRDAEEEEPVPAALQSEPETAVGSDSLMGTGPVPQPGPAAPDADTQPMPAGWTGAMPRPGEALARLRAEGRGEAARPVTAPDEAAAAAPEALAAEAPSNVDVPAPAVGRAMRRAGRVKTRLLGFSAGGNRESDPFASPGTAADEDTPASPGYTEFPVGWLVVVNGPGRGSAFSLFNGVAQIGRGADQTVRLDFGDNSISRANHAAIAYDAEQRKFYLGHGGKANLVRLNNRPVLSTEEIENGHLIRIGETTLRFVALCGAGFDWTEGQEGAQNNVSFG